MIAKCDCVHPFHDAKYGKGMRVHNAKHDKEGTNARCAVCRKEKKVNTNVQ